MEKFLKSIFTSSERKKSIREAELEEDRDFTPPLDGRRKLSISRSGRMKQANKKRHELNLELYGEVTQSVEKPKSLEYHVNKPATEQHGPTKPSRRRLSLDPEPIKERTEQREETQLQEKEIIRGQEELVKTPEEEIEMAFEIIEKVS